MVGETVLAEETDLAGETALRSGEVDYCTGLAVGWIGFPNLAFRSFEAF